MAGNPFYNKSFVSLNDYTVKAINFILDKAREMYEEDLGGNRYSDVLKNKVFVRAFFEDSTRTIESFGQAACELGMKRTGFRTEEGTSSIKGETTFHTLETYRQLHGGIAAVRHPLEGSVRMLSECLKSDDERLCMPVINAGDGAHEHPTQALLDIYAISQLMRETGKTYEKLHPVFVGDNKYGRTVHSLAPALARLGVRKFTFINPEKLKPPQYMLEQLGDSEIVESTELGDALQNADFCYAMRLQRERFGGSDTEFQQALKDIQIRTRRLNQTRDHFRLYHPLPIDKNNPVVHPECDTHPKTYYFQQMEGGLFVRKALIRLIKDTHYGDFHGEVRARPEQYKLNSDFMKELQVSVEYKQKNIPDIIEKGTVIDHIPEGLVSLVQSLLIAPNHRFRSEDALPSKTLGRKGLVKVKGILSSEEELARIATVVPSVTVTFVDNGRPLKKFKLTPPNVVTKISDCFNRNCITRPEHSEHVESKMYLERGDRVRCAYCDHRHTLDEFVKPLMTKYKE